MRVVRESRGRGGNSDESTMGGEWEEVERKIF